MLGPLPRTLSVCTAKDAVLYIFQDLCFVQKYIADGKKFLLQFSGNAKGPDKCMPLCHCTCV